MDPYLKTSLMLGISVALTAVVLFFIISDKRRNAFPLYAIFILGWDGTTALRWLAEGSLIKGILHGVTASVAAWAIYEWWRMKRKGQPSKVLGYIRDLGHKLTVQPVPVRE